MINCCIKRCNSSYSSSQKNDEGLSFFRFPKNETLKKLWTDNIGIANIKSAKVMRICSKHFEEVCINRTLGVVRLKDDVIPTIFPFTSSSIQLRTPLPIISDNIGNTAASSQISSAKAEEKIQKFASLVQQQRKKIKMLNQKCRRLKKKVFTYQNIINELKKENLVHREGAIFLEECAGSPEFLIVND